MTAKIPLSRLSRACDPQMAIVRQEWPHGIPLTEEAAIRCVKLRLNVAWAATELLTDPAALKEYAAVTNQAGHDYVRAMTPLWENPELEGVAYQHARDPIEETYYRTIALALLRLLLAETTKPEGDKR